jgi:TRAP-type C4-dicarboxylate transport system substrate-binding protein
MRAMNPTVVISRASAAVLALVAVGLVAPPATQAQTIKVKMATLVPDGSSWHLVLKETADEWKRISGGRVTVSLFAGGVAGDDPDVVRKMRLGTLQAGVLTSMGVGEVDRSVFALGVPMAYASYEEVYAVLDKLRPRLEATLDAKGFVVLNWADGGWVHFFTQKPVARPEDLRPLKLFTWAGDTDVVEIWKSVGFNPVPLQVPDLMTGLQTGLVNAVGAPPQVSVISQYFVHAKNMTDLKWQLLLGATLINKSTWEQIPADLRPALLEATRQAGARLQQQIRASETRDVEEMQKRGLNVVPVDARALAEWQALAESTYPRIRGKVVPAEVFDEALRLRDDLRKTATKPAKR